MQPWIFELDGLMLSRHGACLLMRREVAPWEQSPTQVSLHGFISAIFVVGHRLHGMYAAALAEPMRIRRSSTCSVSVAGALAGSSSSLAWFNSFPFRSVPRIGAVDFKRGVGLHSLDSCAGTPERLLPTPSCNGCPLIALRCKSKQRLYVGIIERLRYTVTMISALLLPLRALLRKSPSALAT